MTKTFLQGIGTVLLLLSSSSCLKSYDCECVTTESGNIVHTATDTYMGSKKSTQKTCDDFEDGVNSIGQTSTSRTECTLK